MIIDSPGIYNISLDEYHSDPCAMPSLSRSVIVDLINRSPAHAWYRHPKLNPNYQKEEVNERFDLGQVAHSLLLEGIDNVSVVEAEDWRTKAAKEMRDDARAVGKIPLLLHQYEEVRRVVESANEQILGCGELEIKDLREDGNSEQSYFWQEDGIWCRVRPDWCSKDRQLIIDYKTTQNSANPPDLARLITSMGYDIQDIFYTMGVKAFNTTKKDPKFIFVFQEMQEPYLCSFVGLPPEFLEMARQKVEFGMFMWRECLEQNNWPGYPNRVCWIDMPAWAYAAWDKKATDLGIGG